MKKILSYMFLFLFLAVDVYALSLSRVKTWGNEVLTATDLNAEFDNIINRAIVNADISSTAAIVGSKLDLTIPGAIGGTTPAAGTFTTLTSNGNTTIGDAAADSLSVNANTITFEGATADDFETTLTITDPTADRTITIPNLSGAVLPTGAVYFMVTGSCPAGTTDVSATYSNKFVRINATAGSTGGADTHTHSAGTFTTGTHSHTGNTGGISFTSGTVAYGPASDVNHIHSISTESAMAVSGTSASGDNVPAYVTMIACQVN